jgi:hypothetical protein
MRYGYSEGTAIYLIAAWEFPIFIATADGGILSLTLFPLITLLSYSGNDPAGVCNVESIQKNPLYPLVHVCATGYCFHCFPWHLQWLK